VFHSFSTGVNNIFWESIDQFISCYLCSQILLFCLQHYNQEGMGIILIQLGEMNKESINAFSCDLRSRVLYKCITHF
jgi:hypothetical protein